MGVENTVGGNIKRLVVPGSEPNLESSRTPSVHTGSVLDAKFELYRGCAEEFRGIDRIVGGITMNRWRIKENGQDAPGTAYHTQEDLRHLDRKSNFLVSDTSKPTEDYPNPQEVRKDVFNELYQNSSDNQTTYVMTPETQEVVYKTVIDCIRNGREFQSLKDELGDQLGSVIRGILTDTGYASQRQKVDMFVGALHYATDTVIALFTCDDDMRYREKKAYLPSVPDELKGMNVNNSQIIIDSKLDDTQLEFGGENSLEGFFEVGKTLGEMREKDQGFKSYERMYDDMSVALKNASVGPQLFTVSCEGKYIKDPDARVVSITAAKNGIPDFRTVDVFDSNIRSGLPSRETMYYTYQSSPQEPNAFRGSVTNIDSANISQIFDDITSRITRWFVSSLDISLRNGTEETSGKTKSVVASPYRADNEMLPTLFEKLYALDQKQYNFVYGCGFGTDCVHSRTGQGYRPGQLEATTASLVGHVAAAEAVKRLRLDKNGEMVIDTDGIYDRYGEISKSFLQEEPGFPESLEYVFERLQDAYFLCEQMSEKYPEKKQAYETLMKDILKKMKGGNEDVFVAETKKEIAAQVVYFGNVLKAAPYVRTILQGILTGQIACTDGQYGYPLEVYSK